MRKTMIALWCVMVQLSANGIYATFSVEAQQRANLAFDSSGIVNKVLVEVATDVKKGEVLASLNHDDLEAKVKISKIALKYAQKEYERQLKVKHLIDKSKFDAYAFKYENAKAQLRYQQSLLNKTYLKAPFDGVIYAKNVEVGDVVTGMNPKTVFQIQSKSKRKLLLAFDQKYWQKVSVGDLFRFHVDGDEQEHQAKIAKIYPYANSDNRKIQAEVYVDGFVVGLFGDGYIVVDGE